VAFGGVVTPLDAVVRVEYHHPVGMRAASLPETGQGFCDLLALLGLRAFEPVEQRKHVIPYAAAIRHLPRRRPL
jgi:hypothetical protein